MGFTVGVIVANNNHYSPSLQRLLGRSRGFLRGSPGTTPGRTRSAPGQPQANQDERQRAQDEPVERRRQGSPNPKDRHAGPAPGRPAPRRSAGRRQGSATAAPGPIAARSEHGEPLRAAGRAPTASRSSGMSSGGISGYQSGSTTRSQSSRGNSSVSSSRGGGGGAEAGGGR